MAEPDGQVDVGVACERVVRVDQVGADARGPGGGREERRAERQGGSRGAKGFAYSGDALGRPKKVKGVRVSAEELVGVVCDCRADEVDAGGLGM